MLKGKHKHNNDFEAVRVGSAKVAPNNRLKEDLSNNEYVGMEPNHDGQALENVEDVSLDNRGEHLDVAYQNVKSRAKLKAVTLLRKLEPVSLILKRRGNRFRLHKMPECSWNQNVLGA